MYFANTFPRNIPIQLHNKRSGIHKTVILLLALTQCLTETREVAANSAVAAGSRFSQNRFEKDDENKRKILSSTFGLYDLSTFDVTEQAGKLHLLVGGKKLADSKRLTLRYLQYNPDDGQWRIITTLDEKLPEAIASRGNDIQIAAHGDTLVALWQTKGELPGIGPMVSCYSTDAGKTWQLGANPGINTEEDIVDINEAYIDLVADTKGHFHAVWLSDPEEKGSQSLYYSRTYDHGKSWHEPVILDASTCACCWNKLIPASDDRLFVLYRDAQPRDMALIQSDDNGDSWHFRGHVGQFGWGFNGCPHIGGGLSHDGLKNSSVLHAIVWTGHETSSGLYYLGSTNNGHSWTNPNAFGENALNGDIAGHGKKVVAVWNQMEAEGLSVHISISGDGGSTWSQPTAIANAARATIHPKIVTTPMGFIVLWTENPSGKSSQLAWYIIE